MRFCCILMPLVTDFSHHKFGYGGLLVLIIQKKCATKTLIGLYSQSNLSLYRGQIFTDGLS